MATEVLSPAALSVADARTREAPDAVLAFRVTLDRTRHAAVTVDYAISDGTATEGADYTATSGTLTFAPGDTEKTVSVTVLDDAHDDGKETLTLSNPSGARIADGTATVTIETSDSLQRAWLARFGRLSSPGGMLEGLREPLERGAVMLRHAGESATLLAGFQLVTAMSRCPCEQCNGTQGVRRFTA